ncbi:PP2C family protein-serine/threonine phosphatase [Nocardioides sp. LHG3406-4]|uniref:PP2C family protein-serine/threonine phosphatase n=1 Tax=Nocardioides sp. LHG3406-4 TaxID=2804575 RepID=UPI003CFA3683
MLMSFASLTQRLSAYVRARVDGWRSGSSESQVFTLLVLLGGVTLSFVVSWSAYDLLPLTAYFVWLLIGMLLLRFAPLVILSAYVGLAATTALVHEGAVTGARAAALASLAVAIALILYQSSRQRSGLPMPLSEALLVDLRDRLRSQGTVPTLPAGWEAQSAVQPANGGRYAGDFLVVDLRDDRHLEMVLVDVCGKGLTAGPQALQFAGALGGLIGALPPRELMLAANDFLLRQHSDESFSTAVHLLVDLEDGSYAITSAGHPPALHWHSHTADGQRAWEIDNARGTALGIVQHPELHGTVGQLAPGDALMFYTDGVIESRGSDIDTGIAWLQEVAREAVRLGFSGAARRIVRRVAQGDDDRAVLILARSVDVGIEVRTVSTAAG